MSPPLSPPPLRKLAARSGIKMTRKKTYVLIVVGSLLALFVCFLVLLFKQNWNELMTMVSPLEAGASDTVRIFDKNDKVICTISGNEDRVPVQLSQISQSMRQAVVAAEDHSFFAHHGVDPQGIVRAALADIKSGRVVQGGSTITQQLAKTLYSKGARRTVLQKIKESAIAWQLENRYSKEKILESYLNQVYFGKGAYGVERAAEVYFGKAAIKLNLAESAFLAALINAPSTLSLPQNRKAAEARQEFILDAMVDCGFVSKEKAELAKKLPISFRAQSATDSYYLYYVDAVMDELRSKFSSDGEVKLDGFSVYTNMDPTAQKLAVGALNKGVIRAPRGVRQAALVSISVSDGAVIALVGGAGDYWKHQYNRATSPHTVGSAFKPFVYLAGIISGAINPHTVLHDEPIVVTQSQTTPYSPRNFDHQFMGPLTVREALARSRNVCAVKVAVDTGIDKVIEIAKLAGIRRQLEPHVSLALGTCAVSPLEMAAAYGTLARGGVAIEPSLIRSVKDFSGKTLFQVKHGASRVFDTEANAELVDVLQDVVRWGTGTAAQLPGRSVAGKTGTADQSKDLWFVGFTPDLVTATWGGNDENRAIPGSRATGGSVMAGIWHDYMLAYYKAHPVPAAEFPAPATPMDSQALLSPIEVLGEGIEDAATSIENSVDRAADRVEEHVVRKKKGIVSAVGRFFKAIFD